MNTLRDSSRAFVYARKRSQTTGLHPCDRAAVLQTSTEHRAKCKLRGFLRRLLVSSCKSSYFQEHQGPGRRPPGCRSLEGSQMLLTTDGRAIFSMYATRAVFQA